MYTEPHACHVYTSRDTTTRVQRKCKAHLRAPSRAQSRFLAMMVEDRAQTSMNYVEFLCHIHRQIQSKFT